MWHRLLLLLLFFISFSANASNQVVSFEPAQITLKGDIIMLTFPGPPEFESIKKGDMAEKGPYLILSNPVDVQSPPTQMSNHTETDETQKNVKLIQLVVFNKNDWKRIKQGNKVLVTGTLFSAITGHHHARVLLKVKKIEVISKQKISDKALEHITVEDKQYLQQQHLQH